MILYFRGAIRKKSIIKKMQVGVYFSTENYRIRVRDCDDADATKTTNCDDCDTSKDDLKNTFGGKEEILNGVSDAINKHADKLGITSKSEIQHFLAQAAHESNNFNSTREGTNYQPRAVMAYFGRLFNPIGHDDRDPNKKNLSDFGTYVSTRNCKTYMQDSQGLFNHIYDDANRISVGYSPIGNTQSGDGWNYIGRGVIQLTGRENYQNFSNWYRDNVDPNSDIINNPELLNSNKEIGTLASLWFFKNNVIDPLGGIDENTTANEVTKKVNTAMLKKEERAENLEKAKQNIDCK